MENSTGSTTLMDPGMQFYATRLIDHEYPYSVSRTGVACFAALLLVEYAMLLVRGKSTPRFNDTVTSLSLGILHECCKMVTRGLEMAAYIYVHDRYRLTDARAEYLPHWILVAVAFDFAFYWMHRASHEINILWAHHQVHHSADDFNVSVGVRHGIFYSIISCIFYVPLALFTPPFQFVVQRQLNGLYQLWIHTEAVDSLGFPFEWVFNTPQHHQVHHGVNNYLLDKNYGGILIVWDRLFGTFVEKRPERITYSLVHPPKTFNPIALQTYYFPYLWERMKNAGSWGQKMQVLVKGPSWVPGSPWTGWENSKPTVGRREKFDVPISAWRKWYIAIHFLCLVTNLIESHDCVRGYSTVGYIAFSLAVLGCLIGDSPSWCWALELGRCVAYIVISRLVFGAGSRVHWLYYCSVAIWSFVAYTRYAQ